MTTYRGMDRAALDAAYNNAAAVADSQDFIARWREESAAARSGPLARLDIPYGGRPRERFDYFAAGRARPPLSSSSTAAIGNATTRTPSRLSLIHI